MPERVDAFGAAPLTSKAEPGDDVGALFMQALWPAVSDPFRPPIGVGLQLLVTNGPTRLGASAAPVHLV